jgi:nucleoside-diphosphate-sugar epimerase
MSASNDIHVVLGASGGVGGAVVRELVACGRRVRAVSRGGRMEAPAGVEVMAGDVSQPESARAVCQNGAVVFLCSNPGYDKWAEQFPPMLEGAIAGASAAGAKLVFPDNLYVYAPPSAPMTEDLPWAPVTRKGLVRKQLDETLLAAQANGTVRAVIGRASDYYGPGGTNSATGARFFGQLLAGKPVQWLGKLDVPHSLSYLADFASGLVTLGERDEALGQAWHIPAAAPLTGRQFIALAATQAGVPPSMAPVPPLMLRMAGLFSPLIRETVEMHYEFLAPFIMDGSKYTRAFGFTPTPHAEALRQTIAWYRAHPASGTP